MTIIIDSVHEPLPSEREAVVKAALATGVKQGFEPYRATVVPPNPNDGMTIETLPDVMEEWKRTVS